MTSLFRLAGYIQMGCYSRGQISDYEAATYQGLCLDWCDFTECTSVTWKNDIGLKLGTILSRFNCFKCLRCTHTV